MFLPSHLAATCRVTAVMMFLCTTLLAPPAAAQTAPVCSEAELQGLARAGEWAVSGCTRPAPHGSVPTADDIQQPLTFNHYVRHPSTSPVLLGQPVDLYLRERVAPRTLAETPTPANVVLFVHGASLGSTGAFDLAYQDYSWMAYLAEHGFDAFSLDLTGYGYSTRPSPMNDPCNLSSDQQAQLAAGTLPTDCPASFATQLTTVQSEWDDLNAVVDYVRTLRGVDRVSLVGWSLGGSRVGGYAALHPEKVGRMVLLAPAYDRDQPALAAPPTPDAGAPLALISRAMLTATWDRQVQCAGQVDPGIRDAIWTEGLAADGVAWEPEMRRVPTTPAWRWNRSIAGAVQAPTLLVSGEFDQMVSFTVPDAVRAAYADLGTSQKVFVDLACSSHYAMWESRHTVLFAASLEWLKDGTVNGANTGSLRLGD